MKEASLAAEVIMTQLRRVIGPVFSARPFSSSRAQQLSPDRLSNIISTMQNLTSFLPKLARIRSHEVRNILNLANRMLQALNFSLILNKSFSLDFSLDTLKKERLRPETVAELEAMTLRDFFERGLQGPEVCQLVEAFLGAMHRQEQRRDVQRQSFLAFNSRLVEELKNKCCKQFLTTEFLALVQGRYSLQVAFDLMQKQQALGVLTEEDRAYDPHKVGV